MRYFLAVLAAGILSTLLVPWVKKLAVRVGAVDAAPKESRRVHTKSTPRAGGLAIYASFVLVCGAFLGFSSSRFVGLLVAGTIVLLVGLVDDIHSLSPWLKLGLQLVAALVACLGFGISIDALSNPGGAAFNFTTTQWHLSFGHFVLTINVLATGLTVLWLVGMTNTMNFLDGLDGLSAGVAVIAAVIMFFLSIGARVNQPDTALIALVLAASCVGFLIYNFYPASIFVGDSGAYFLGMTIGILAIFSGAKLATAMLVLGLPIIDSVWAVVRRLLTGKSPFRPDRGHIHHLLLDSGLSQRTSVLVIYSFSIVFGGVALIATTSQKILAFGCLALILSGLIIILSLRRRRLTR